MGVETQEVATTVPTEVSLPVIPVVSGASTYEGPRRYQIRFPETAAYFAARAAEAPARFRIGVASSRRAVLGVEVPSSVAGPSTALRNEATALEYFSREYGAQIMEDYQYTMDLTSVFEVESFLSPESAQASLDDVVTMTRADQAWQLSTGENVVIAVVDTGINGSHPEFPLAKRAGSWQEPSDAPWTDWLGHGTMCAAIAAGTTAAGGRYNGIAPGARLIACKTRFFDTQLAAVYDYLSDLVESKGMKIVATNSYGIPVGAAPPPPEAIFLEALNDAINAGVSVVFSAGNYHELAGGQALACAPTTIWQYKVPG
jgi:serine protease AprX